MRRPRSKPADHECAWFGVLVPSSVRVVPRGEKPWTETTPLDGTPVRVCVAPNISTQTGPQRGRQTAVMQSTEGGTPTCAQPVRRRKGGTGYCTRKATLFEDGLWWCRQHAPSGEAARLGRERARRSAYFALRHHEGKVTLARGRVLVAAENLCESPNDAAAFQQLCLAVRACQGTQAAYDAKREAFKRSGASARWK